MLRRVFRRLRGRLDLALPSDTAFLERAYREVLSREIDQDGLDYYRARLRDGETRGAVLLSLMGSEEFLKRRGTPAHAVLPDLCASHPERYRQAVDRTTGRTVRVFEARTAEDYDWIEAQILSSRYYDQPGVWNLGVDVDKRVMAEIVASLGPANALELGCAAGAVLRCLHELGVAAEGVELSASAAEAASPETRASIRIGDLLSVDLPDAFDVTFGLDVFEHLNPNRLDRYLGRLASLTREGGYVFVNVPAFGRDPVFGTVFPLYLDGWEDDARAGRVFRMLHADDLGYPLHGHLVWADASWWVRRFEEAGLSREAGIERALHAKYDGYMDKRSRARKAFFVFSRNGAAERARSIIEGIRSVRSRVLA